MDQLLGPRRVRSSASTSLDTLVGVIVTVAASGIVPTATIDSVAELPALFGV